MGGQKGGFDMKELYLGKRSMYSYGNSKAIGVPRDVVKKLEKKNIDTQEVELVFNTEDNVLKIFFNNSVR